MAKNPPIVIDTSKGPVDLRPASFEAIAQSNAPFGGAGSRFDTGQGSTGSASGSVTQIREGGIGEGGEIIFQAGGSGSAASQPVGQASIQQAQETAVAQSQQQTLSRGDVEVSRALAEKISGKPQATASRFFVTPSQKTATQQTIQPSQATQEVDIKKDFSTPERFLLFGKDLREQERIKRDRDKRDRSFFGLTESLVEFGKEGVTKVKGGFKSGETSTEALQSLVQIGTGAGQATLGVLGAGVSSIVEPAAFALFTPKDKREQLGSVSDRSGGIGDFQPSQATQEVQAGIFQLGVIGTQLTVVKPTPTSTVTKPLSAKEDARFRKDFNKFLNKEGINKGAIVTSKEAVKIQEFLLKFNRQGQKTAVVPKGKGSLVKTKTGKSTKSEVGVELRLKPVESVTVVGKETGVGGAKIVNRFAFFRKGKAELVRPQDINRFDVIEVSGSQRISNQPIFTNKKAGVSFNKITDKTNTKLISQGGKGGQVQTNAKSVFDSTRPVKSRVPVEDLNKLLATDKISSKTPTSVSEVSSFNAPGGKVLKVSSVIKTPSGNKGDVFELTNLNIKGVNIKGGKGSPFNLRKIGRDFAFKSKSFLEDLRFRIGFTEKKALTSSPFKDVIETDAGVFIKVSAFEGTGSTLKTITTFIERPGQPKIFFSPTVKETTTSPINSPDVEISPGSGGNQATIQIVRPEEPSNVGSQLVGGKQKTDTGTKTGTKSGSKSETGTKSDFKSDFGTTTGSAGIGGGKFFPESGVAFSDGGNVFTPESTTFRVVPVSKVGGIPIISFSGGGSSKFQSSIKSIIGSASASGSAAVSSISTVQTQTPASSSAFFTGSAVGMDVPSLSKTLTDSVTSSLTFSRPNDTRQLQRRRRFVPPPPFLRFKNKQDFGVEVRRFGEFKEIGRASSKSAAIGIGVRRVESTAAASFRVTRLGSPVSVRSPSGSFRIGSGNVVIERRERRIKSPGELREITFKGIRSPKRKSKKRKSFELGGLSRL